MKEQVKDIRDEIEAVSDQLTSLQGVYKELNDAFVEALTARMDNLREQSRLIGQLQIIREIQRGDREEGFYRERRDREHKTISAEEKTWARKKYLEGAPIEELAKSLQRTPAAVEYILGLRSGPEDRHKPYESEQEAVKPERSHFPWEPADEVEMKRLYVEEDLDFKTLADKFQRSEAAIYARLHDGGLIKEKHRGYGNLPWGTRVEGGE